MCVCVQVGGCCVCMYVCACVCNYMYVCACGVWVYAGQKSTSRALSVTLPLVPVMTAVCAHTPAKVSQFKPWNSGRGWFRGIKGAEEL